MKLKILDFNWSKQELIDYHHKREKKKIEDYELKETLMIPDFTKTSFMRFEIVELGLNCLKDKM